MVSRFWELHGLDANVIQTREIENALLSAQIIIENITEEELVYTGMELAKLYTASVRQYGDEESLTLATKVRSKDYVDGVLPPPKNIKALLIDTDLNENIMDDMNSWLQSHHPCSHRLGYRNGWGW